MILVRAVDERLVALGAHEMPAVEYGDGRQPRAFADGALLFVDEQLGLAVFVERKRPIAGDVSADLNLT
jgi:hypothetical protein